MDRGSKARIETTVVTVFLILLLITVPLMYFVLEAPPFMVLGVAVGYLIVAVLVLFYARQRFKEIEEGLEDAVDNY
ncbi:MAG: hypothetical protein ACI38Y_00865 [Candidatus Methanomethylophilaceae archaeon]